MIQKKIIRLSVIVSPDIMGKDWKTKMNEALGKQFEGKCTKEYGYLIKINEISRLLEQVIMRTGGGIRCLVDVWAETLKPEVGDEIEATIDLITPHGVFCRFRELRMLLPLKNCGSFSIRQDFSSSSLVDQETKKTIKKHDVIRVQVQDVRFENDRYTCLVSLVL